MRTDGSCLLGRLGFSDEETRSQSHVASRRHPLSLRGSVAREDVSLRTAARARQSGIGLRGLTIDSDRVSVASVG
jgi:hypothetical protein